MKLRLDFCNQDNQNDIFSLTWQVMNIPPAQRWIRLLDQILKKNYPFETRYVGFINGKRNHHFLSQKMNRCIEVINKDGRYKIIERAQGPFTQEFSNAIHHHFEVLSGPIWNRTKYFKESPIEVSIAVRGLNDLIHEMESYDRGLINTKLGIDTGAAICNKFYNCEKEDLSSEDYEHFSLEKDFGVITLHYSQIGKTWFEVFNDEDEDVYPEAILPLRKMAPNFDISFYSYSQMS